MLRILQNIKSNFFSMDHLQEIGVLDEEWKKAPDWMESKGWHRQEIRYFPFGGTLKFWVPHVNSEQGMRKRAFLGPSGDKGNRRSWRSPECWHLISSSNGKLQILTSSGTAEDVPAHNHPRGEELWLHLPPKGKERTNVMKGWNS